MFTIKKIWVFRKYECCTTIIKRFRWSSQSCKLFSDLFGMPSEEAKQFRFENKLRPLTEERLYDLVEFCKNIGISQLQLTKYPLLFKEAPLSLEQRYIQLNEGGVQANLEILSYYRKCVRKKIDFLKAYNYIPDQTNVVESFVSYLEPKPSRHLIDDITEDNSFEQIHHTLLTRYLMWRFDTSYDVIQKFYRVYSLTKIRSFKWLSENFAIAESLGFSPEKIMKNGYVLTFCPRNTRAVLDEIPILPGDSIRKAAHLYPKLLGVPIKNYIQIYDCLKKSNISEEAILKNINVFLLCPTTLETRLKEIKSVPELKVLIDNPRILRLIVRHNESRSRLSFLQQIKLKCASVNLLAAKLDTFNLRIREGKDVNTTFDMVSLIAYLLKNNSPLIEKNLKLHQYFRHVPLIEIEKSIKYLKKLQFPSESIIDVIQISLYPRNKLEEAYQKMCKIKQSHKRKVTAVQKLNLMLYYLEKEHHFTGNGIWNNNTETK